MAEALVRRSSSKCSQTSTVDDLLLPSPRTPIFDGDQTFELPERCNSESDLTLLDDTPSKLNVSGRQFTLGNCGKVKVTWDIKEEYGADDWIGLFPFGMSSIGSINLTLGSSLLRLKSFVLSLSYMNIHARLQGAQWLIGRVLDSRPRGRGFEPHRRHCLVVLEQDTFILA